MGKEDFSISLLKKTLRRKHDFQEALGKMRLGEAEIEWTFEVSVPVRERMQVCALKDLTLGR